MNKSITHVNYNRKLKLIFSTSFILFNSDNAAGIDAGNVTVMEYDM